MGSPGGFAEKELDPDSHSKGEADDATDDIHGAIALLLAAIGYVRPIRGCASNGGCEPLGAVTALPLLQSPGSIVTAEAVLAGAAAEPVTPRGTVEGRIVLPHDIVVALACFRGPDSADCASG